MLPVGRSVPCHHSLSLVPVYGPCVYSIDELSQVLSAVCFISHVPSYSECHLVSF